MTDRSAETITSPCVRNCCLNDEDICLGCGRKLHEIIAWGSSSHSARQAILFAAAERQQLIRSLQKPAD